MRFRRFGKGPPRAREASGGLPGTGPDPQPTAGDPAAGDPASAAEEARQGPKSDPEPSPGGGGRLGRSWRRRAAAGLGSAVAVAGVAVLSVFIYSIFDDGGRDGSRDRTDRYDHAAGSWEGFESKRGVAWGDLEGERGGGAGAAMSKKCDADGGCLGAGGPAGRLQDGPGDRRGGRFSWRPGSGCLCTGGAGSGPWSFGDSPGAGWGVEGPSPWGQGSSGACFSCDCAPRPGTAGPFAGSFGHWSDRSAMGPPGGRFGIPGAPGAADPFGWGWGGDPGWFGYAPFVEGGPGRPSPWPGPEDGDGFWSHEGDGPGVPGGHSGGGGLGLGGWDVLVMWIMELLSDPEVLSELLDSLGELLGEDGPLQGMFGSDGSLDGLFGLEGLEGFEGDEGGLFGPGGLLDGLLGLEGFEGDEGGLFGPGGLLDGLLGLEGFEGDDGGPFEREGPFGELMDDATGEEVPTPQPPSA